MSPTTIIPKPAPTRTSPAGSAGRQAHRAPPTLPPDARAPSTAAPRRADDKPSRLSPRKPARQPPTIAAPRQCPRCSRADAADASTGGATTNAPNNTHAITTQKSHVRNKTRRRTPAPSAPTGQSAPHTIAGPPQQRIQLHQRQEQHRVDEETLVMSDVCRSPRLCSHGALSPCPALTAGSSPHPRSPSNHTTARFARRSSRCTHASTSRSDTARAARLRRPAPSSTADTSSP